MILIHVPTVFSKPTAHIEETERDTQLCSCRTQGPVLCTSYRIGGLQDSANLTYGLRKQQPQQFPIRAFLDWSEGLCRLCLGPLRCHSFSRRFTSVSSTARSPSGSPGRVSHGFRPLLELLDSRARWVQARAP